MNKRGKSSPSNPSQNSFMQQSERKPSRTEVPEVKARAVECRDGLARIALEELAITHSVKDGILQNACSTKKRMVAVLGNIVRLMNNQVKSMKRMMTKV